MTTGSGRQLLNGLVKWAAFALLMLAPGSFVIVPVALFAQWWRTRGRGAVAGNEPRRVEAGNSQPA